MNKAYVKQLEEENEALKKRLEVADLKGECYDYILRNMVTEASHGFATQSKVGEGGFIIFSKSEIDEKSMACMKIANDMIEDIKVMQGHKKK
jgi:transcriptional regulator CtsR